MKSVLMSIQPKQCENIANRKQTIIVCKTTPKEAPFKCFIYCTKSAKQLIAQDYATTLDYIAKKGGKVIGEFVCDKIIKISAVECADGIQRYQLVRDNLMSLTKESCLDIEEINDYGVVKDRGCWGIHSPLRALYFWHISNLKIYDKPKELSEFGVWCKEFEKEEPFCVDCDYQSIDWSAEPAFDCKCNGFKPLLRPPQSWRYVEFTEKE